MRGAGGALPGGAIVSAKHLVRRQIHLLSLYVHIMLANVNAQISRQPMSHAPCSDAEKELDESPIESPVEGGELRVTRRTFVQSAGVLAAGVAVHASAIAEAQDARAGAAQVHGVTVTINGKAERMSLDTRTTLLDALRDHLDLTGSKKGCDHGQCGACTVLVDGRRVNACLTLLATVDGAAVTTIEGMAEGETPGQVQEAFLHHDGFQCGYCTPGQICSATALIEEHKRGMLSQVSWEKGFGGAAGGVALSDDEIRERMSGNLCRCGAYPNIVAAVRTAMGMGAATPPTHDGETVMNGAPGLIGDRAVEVGA
jgi:xanthine dehydrogenase YagT iron-sulfur-binding subunit